MIKCGAFIAWLVVGIFMLDGQDQLQRHFSAASVKADPENGPYPPLRIGPGSFSAGEPLIFFLRYAYQVTDVLGAPDWAWNKVFDVQARTGAIASPEEMRAMVKDLLSERFGLRAHIERRSGRGYALAVKGIGPKLKSHVDQLDVSNPHAIKVAPQVIIGVGASMEQLANALSLKLRVPVENQTRLEGTFDFTVLFESTVQVSQGNEGAAGAAPFPLRGDVEAFPIGLADIGLALLTKTVNRDVLIVEAARLPSEN